jgi:hypothetical protein
VQLYYEHIDMNYDQTDPPQPPQDFKADVARGRYTYYFSPRTSVFAEYRYVNKDLDEESADFFDYEIQNPRVGFSLDLYENLNLTVSGGYALRKADDTDDDEIFTGRLYSSGEYKSLNVTVYGERGFFDDYTSADSDGFYKFWRTGLDARYQILERLWFDASLFFEKDKFVDRDRTDKFYNARARLNYRILKRAYLSLDYQYNERDSNIPFDDYQRNRVFFRITFEHDIAERFE